MVSLCYQPAANRLTVVVLKSRNLPKMDFAGLCGKWVLKIRIYHVVYYKKIVCYKRLCIVIVIIITKCGKVNQSSIHIFVKNLLFKCYFLNIPDVCTFSKCTRTFKIYRIKIIY